MCWKKKERKKGREGRGECVEKERSNRGGKRVLVAANLPFITTWNISVPNETVTLPLLIAPSANLSVDWGDGQVEADITAFPISHTYVTSGLQNLSIFGDIYQFAFQQMCKRLTAN